MNKLKLFVFIFCILMFVALLPMVASAEVLTCIDSDIEGEVTWEKGTYYICKTADDRQPIVKQGSTLTIASGSKVYFGNRVNVPTPIDKDKYPYPYLEVNGTLNATGVTFTTVPDTEEGTPWKNAGWNGIQAKSIDSSKPASLSFTDCIFEYSSGTEGGTLYGVDNSGGDDGQTINITVSGCTFIDPIKKEADGFYAAIRYNNGYYRAGKGTISVLNTTFTDYDRGIIVNKNNRDEIDISIVGCTFNNIIKEPVRLESGKSAFLQNCTFNNIKSGMERVADIFYSQNETSSADQTVTISGNTFNGDGTTVNYPIVVGANAKINENVVVTNNTFNNDYPTAYRYIVFNGSVGSITGPRVENAVWGDAGTPYLMTSGVKVSENGTENDGIYSTLIIKPGVTINFDEGVGLTVDGELTAEGEDGKPITFQKKQGVEWSAGISASGSLEGPISLKYCELKDLQNGIKINAPSTAATPPNIAIDNCTIESVNYQTALQGKNITVTNSVFTGPGINLTNGSNIKLTDCMITMNAGSRTENGVKIENVDGVTLQGCDITSNGLLGGVGVYINYSKSVLLKNCLIAKFPEYGVSLNGNSYATIEESAPLIENCTIVSNGYAGAIFRYSGNVNNQYEYSPYIKNSIITDNGVAISEGPKLDIIRLAGYAVTIPDGSISYSLIGNDDAPFGPVYYTHPSLMDAGYKMIIYPIPATAYLNRVAGPTHFADAENGDYHLKSEAGRWNGSEWVNDGVTSNCINAGDPTSPFDYEPEDNGDLINIGRYGNTVEASKSNTSNASYTITLPDGIIEGGWKGYTAAAYGSSSSPVAYGSSYSFTITLGGAFYETDAFKVKTNGSELTPVENIYTISNILENQVVTVEGVAKVDSPEITVQPADQNVTAEQNAVFSVAATGHNLSYVWKKSEDNGSTWANIEGATGTQYTVASASVSQSGWKYRCSITSSSDTEDGLPRFSALSNIATLTVVDDGTQYSISVSASPAAGGTVSGGGTVNAGTSVTVTATPNANYNFVKWTENGAQVSTGTSYTFNATASRTLVAVFESAPPPPPPPPTTPPTDTLPPVTDINSGNSTTTSNINNLISENKSLTVEGDDGAKLVFDTDALKGISSQAGSSVKAELSDVSEEYQQSHPGKLVFSLTVTSGDKTITDFGGSVTVSLPYELKDGEDPKSVKVWHLASDGSLTEIPCTYDPVTKQARFIVTHFSLYLVGTDSTQEFSFTDVNEKDWFYENVRFAYESGLMTGTGETTFSPSVNTSRGVIVTILWRLEGEPVTQKSMTFTDVTDGKWYYKAVAWAAENGIVDGYSADKFGPEDYITREQIAKILCSYAAFKNYDVSARDDLSGFTDSPSSWALEYMQWAVAEGLLQGKGNNLLDPRGNTKRSECAAILQRFIEKYKQ